MKVKNPFETETPEREKEFECTFCEEGFDSRDDLRRHQENSHSAEYSEEEEEIWSPTPGR